MKSTACWRSKFFSVGMVIFLTLFMVACGSGGWGDTPPTPPTPSEKYTVGGTVSGLSGSGLVLQNNGGDDLSISADGTFTFAASIASGSNYAVTVKTEPTGQTCAVDNGSGTVAGANITNVSVTCTTRDWEMLSSAANSYSFSDFTPSGESVLYTGNYSGDFYEYVFPTTGNPDGVFNSLASAPGSIDSYTAFAWYGGYLYTAQSDSIYRYDISGDSWSTPQSGLAHSISSAQSTADDYGYVYALTNDGDYLLKYDAILDSVQFISTPGFTSSEPRAAWDSLTQRVYLSDYDYKPLYAFNPADNSYTTLTSFPNDDGVSDAFCSDRRGHIFTTNGSGSGNEVWKYTASTDSWAQIQSLPFAPGSSAVCTVSADGYLYIGDGSTQFARLKVF